MAKAAAQGLARVVPPAALGVVAACRWPQRVAAPGLALLLATVAALWPVPARAQDARMGPLFVRSRAPVWDLRLGFQPGPVAPAAPGAPIAQASLSHVNDWAQMPGYDFDGEWSRLQLRLRVGTGKDTEISLDYSILARMGGRLDSAIEAFHHAFGLTQSRRDRYARNRLYVRTYAANGTSTVRLSNRANGAGRGKPAFGIRHVLARGKPGQLLAGELALGLPLGDVKRHFASRGLELLAGISAASPIAPWLSVQASFGASISPFTHEVWGMPTSIVQKYFFVALMAPMGSHLQAVLQYLNQDGAIESAQFAPLNKTTHEFALGLRALVGSCWAFELGILENTVHDANTPDVGVTLGLMYRAEPSTRGHRREHQHGDRYRR